MDEKAKQTADYDTLVLSGGSTKALVTLGALQYLHDNYRTRKIVNYVGTSAGSMICFLMAIGYTPKEIIVYLCTQQLLEKLQHFNIVAMIQGRGAASFNPIQEQLEKMVIDKIGYLPSLLDIQEKMGKKLICVTHNLTEDRTEYLSHENYPHLPAVTAVRMSSNLPLVFENFKYGSSFYTDGGISDNFAIDTGEKIGNKILGMILKTDINTFDPEMYTLEFIYKLIFTPIQQSSENKIRKASDKCEIVKLAYKKLAFFNFHIYSKEKLEMFSNGYLQMKALTVKTN